MVVEKPKPQWMEGLTKEELADVEARGFKAMREHPAVHPAWRVAGNLHAEKEALAPDAAVGAKHRAGQRKAGSGAPKGSDGLTLEKRFAGFTGSWEEAAAVLAKWADNEVEEEKRPNGDRYNYRR